MNIVLTGAAGFLGWHTRLRLSAVTQHVVVPITRLNWDQLGELVESADAIIHLAGVNRAATEEEVQRGNEKLGLDLASAIAAAKKPLRVVMAGTIQVERDNAYGRGKLFARDAVERATSEAGGHFVDVCLPNLFGEHGRPNYNSFIATFIADTIMGRTPRIDDNLVELLSAQDAAQALIDGLSTSATSLRPAGRKVGVSETWELLQIFHESYVPGGEIPNIDSKFKVDLFNSYRAALFPHHYPIPLTPHSDARGSFVETVRCQGGEGQSSVSTTVPGVTRGDHYHLSKIERFVVVQGTARISLRRKFATEVISFDVSGDQPVAIDMPVGWVHNIKNTGEQTLLTQFWSHELFRPEAPDTYAELVHIEDEESVG